MTLPKLLAVLLLGLRALPLPAQSNVTVIHPTFTTIDVPGAGVTGVYGINSAGDMVGYYGASDNDPNKHGFLYSGGTFTYLDFPGAFSTFAYGINDSGVIVGAAEFNGGLTAKGFSFDGTTYASIRDGNQSATFIFAINNLGDMAGSAGALGANFRAVERRGTKFKTLSVPGLYSIISASGINKTGTVVGWADSDGFICRSSACQIVNYPGADVTADRGVNDKGIIVGWYGSIQCTCAFALKNGKYVSFVFPGAIGTAATAINPQGQVVGQYQTPDFVFHGFVTSPITAADFE